MGGGDGGKEGVVPLLVDYHVGGHTYVMWTCCSCPHYGSKFGQLLCAIIKMWQLSKWALFYFGEFDFSRPDQTRPDQTRPDQIQMETRALLLV